MQAYSAVAVFVLSFGTALSIAWFAIGMRGSEYILASKDLVVALGIALAASIRLMKLYRAKIKPNKLDVAVGLILLVNVLSLLISSAELSLKLVNFRRNLSLFCLLWAFANLGHARKLLKEIALLSFLSFAVLAMFGFIEYFLPDTFWNTTVDIPNYWRQISVDHFGVSTVAESGRFYSWDWTFLTKEPIRRMVSLYLEPTTLAAFILFIFILSLVGKRRVLAFTALAAGLCTMSKFFIVAVLLATALNHFADRVPKRLPVICFAGCTVLAVGAVGIGIRSGALAHLNGIVNLSELIAQKRVLGFGLGAAGNYTDQGSEASDLGAESGVGNIAAQLGVGVLAYLVVINFLFQELRSKWLLSGRKEYLVGIILLITWTVSFFMSASSLGLSGNAFFFMYIGCIFGLKPLPESGGMTTSLQIPRLEPNLAGRSTA